MCCSVDWQGLLGDIIGEQEVLKKRLESSVEKTSEEVEHQGKDVELSPFKVHLRTRSSVLFIPSFILFYFFSSFYLFIFFLFF